MFHWETRNELTYVWDDSEHYYDLRVNAHDSAAKALDDRRKLEHAIAEKIVAMLNASVVPVIAGGPDGLCDCGHEFSQHGAIDHYSSDGCNHCSCTR